MKRLLPIGTVLKLNPEEKEKIMIIGRLVKESEKDTKIWDYCGCNAPIGIAGDEKLIFFNHEQVKQLLFIGFQDEEELQVSVALGEEKEKIAEKEKE